ncbi:hypothetical protein E8E13_011341 [Curvularia kusanoi]|uniref:J domain-containing protein n=1 Tax=Curvularia kusanoi TaxID=90978 RepID=A0A9P4WC68_CURKU|nr:hypothetical protein E8E13_011341 [Curvularia kusanoi]
MGDQSDKYGGGGDAMGTYIDAARRKLMDRGFSREEATKAAKRMATKAWESDSTSEVSQSSGRGRSGHSSSSTYGKSRASGLDNFDTMRDALDDDRRLAKNTRSHDSKYDETTNDQHYSYRIRAEVVSDGTSFAAYVAVSGSYSSPSTNHSSGQDSRGYLEDSRNTNTRAPRDLSSLSSRSYSKGTETPRSNYGESRSSHRDEPRSSHREDSRSYRTQEFRPSGGHADESRSKYQSDSRGYRTQEFRPSGGYHDESRSKYQSQSKSRHQSQYKGSEVSMGVKPETDLYVILGVSASATADEIKNAHRKQCLKNHPDRGGSATMMAKVNQAYDVLKDKELRAFYDRTGKIMSKASSPDA